MQEKTNKSIRILFTFGWNLLLQLCNCLFLEISLIFNVVWHHFDGPTGKTELYCVGKCCIVCMHILKSEDPNESRGSDLL